MLAGVSACATGPAFRPKTPLGAANDDLDVEIDGLEEGPDGPEYTIAAEVLAQRDVALRGATLAAPQAAPCTRAGYPDQTVAALGLDGADAWQRPLPVMGRHRLTLRFPGALGLGERVSGPMTLDIATERAGTSGCLRVPIQGRQDRATWTPSSPWMVGFRIDANPLGVALRAGRWGGPAAFPFIAGLEGAISSRRGTVAALAANRILGSAFSLEAGYVGGWELPGGELPAGTFRNGPRAGLLYGVVTDPRYDGERLYVGGLGVEVTRWWAALGHGASTDVVFTIAAWLSSSLFVSSAPDR
jgi:hypothetical protein